MTTKLQEFQQNLKRALQLKNREELHLVMSTLYDDPRLAETAADWLGGAMFSPNHQGLTDDEVSFFLIVYHDAVAENLFAYYGDEIQDAMHDLLKEKGMVEGLDYAMDDEHIWLSLRALECFEDKLPKGYIEHVRQQYLSTDTIEERLGIPGYFDRVTELALARTTEWGAQKNWKMIVSYLKYFTLGTVCKYGQLENTNFRAIFERRMCDKETFDRLVYLIEEGFTYEMEEEACLCVVTDVLTALGKQHLIKEDEDGVPEIGEEGLRVLSSVWENLGSQPIREIIALLQQEEAANNA